MKEEAETYFVLYRTLKLVSIIESESIIRTSFDSIGLVLK